MYVISTCIIRHVVSTLRSLTNDMYLIIIYVELIGDEIRRSTLG